MSVSSERAAIVNAAEEMRDTADDDRGELCDIVVRGVSALADLAERSERWLESNRKKPTDVRWGSFPLGMVQRWIERAEVAEARKP